MHARHTAFVAVVALAASVACTPATHAPRWADVVETTSFQASRTRLEEWGLADRTLALNRARQAAITQEILEIAAAQYAQ